MGKRILFQGSYAPHRGKRSETPAHLRIAEEISAPLGEALIAAGFDLIFTGTNVLEKVIGNAALAACKRFGENPRERVRTYLSDPSAGGFGMVLEAIGDSRQDVRTFIVREADALIALIGGKGTRDCIQKAELAGKPLFPIAVAGGGALAEWLRLKREGYRHRNAGDIDFLADHGAAPGDLASAIVHRCKDLFAPARPRVSNRVFVVHGHDAELRLELTRMLDKLGLVPVILGEQPDRGRTVLGKLVDELADVGYGIVLLTPDDAGRRKDARRTQPRARQNVIFEHGWLIGALGTQRVCAIVKGGVEIPSDLAGVVYKNIPEGKGVDAIAIHIVQELKSAGYAVDANKLLGA